MRAIRYQTRGANPWPASDELEDQLLSCDAVEGPLLHNANEVISNARQHGDWQAVQAEAIPLENAGAAAAPSWEHQLCIRSVQPCRQLRTALLGVVFIPCQRADVAATPERSTWVASQAAAAAAVQTEDEMQNFSNIASAHMQAGVTPATTASAAVAASATAS